MDYGNSRVLQVRDCMASSRIWSLHDFGRQAGKLQDASRCLAKVASGTSTGQRVPEDEAFAASCGDWGRLEPLRCCSCRSCQRQQPTVSSPWSSAHIQNQSFGSAHATMSQSSLGLSRKHVPNVTMQHATLCDLPCEISKPQSYKTGQLWEFLPRGLRQPSADVLPAADHVTA